MIVTHTEREAETQAEGEAGSMHREPDVGFDPGSPGSRPGPKSGAKPLCHPGTHFSAFLTPPRKKSKKDGGLQKGRPQNTRSHMCLLTWDRMQPLPHHFQSTSAVLTQEWNKAQIWIEDKDLPPVLANLGIVSPQTPSYQMHLQRM